jgi:predicted esterase
MLCLSSRSMHTLTQIYLSDIQGTMVVPDLVNKHIFMSSGLYDPIVPKQERERLFSLVKKAEAKLSLYWQGVIKN